ncbi:uncharacterized protein ARMOST_18735 [Armillaria ostoyae]|uniref:Uncharacterized protein n=1 Tax=Armillaria ostoyae TaxID=47428 RepID=A0A284S2Q6_ARMOS|nr:uncharacterized protein ARMOST_18735 [Armillaria ostoyae]
MFLYNNPSYPDSHHLRCSFLMLTTSAQMQYGTGVVSVVVRPISIFDLALHLDMLDAEVIVTHLPLHLNPRDKMLSDRGMDSIISKTGPLRWVYMPPKAKLRIDVPFFQYVDLLFCFYDDTHRPNMENRAIACDVPLS